MAVTMTTKFYEEDTPAWHDLSKVVFTSPNIDSPNTAGTRSHILPGQADLGLWYEDDSNMYRASVKQDKLPTSDEHPMFIGRMGLYSAEEFSFANDNSVLLDYQSFGATSLYNNDILYYNVDNYGTVVSTTTVTSGILDVEEESITVHDGFSEGRKVAFSYKFYWTATGIYTYDDVNIYDSVDGGINWISVASNSANDGEHVFTIPTVTTIAKLKVESASNPFIKDESIPFTITDGILDTLIPTIGTNWSARSTHRMWWNCTHFFQEEQLGIDISFNDGVDWVTLVSGISNDGVAVINIPDIYYEFTKLKIYSTANPSGTFDESSVFGVYYVGSEILVPSISSIWRNRHDHKVWWNSDNFYNDELLNVKISYDDGSSWETLSSGIVNTGNSVITLASGISTTTVVRVESSNDPEDSYDNSPVFTTWPGSLDLLSPSTADLWYNYRSHKLWWNSDAFYDNETVDIVLSYDVGISWDVLKSEITNTGYAIIDLPLDKSGEITNSTVSRASAEQNKAPLKSYY